MPNRANCRWCMQNDSLLDESSKVCNSLIHLLKSAKFHLSAELSVATPASSRVPHRFQTRNRSRKEGVLLRRSGQSMSVKSHQLHSEGLGTLRAGSSDTTRLIRP